MHRCLTIVCAAAIAVATMVVVAIMAHRYRAPIVVDAALLMITLTTLAIVAIIPSAASDGHNKEGFVEDPLVDPVTVEPATEEPLGMLIVPQPRLPPPPPLFGGTVDATAPTTAGPDPLMMTSQIVATPSGTATSAIPIPTTVFRTPALPLDGRLPAPQELGLTVHVTSLSPTSYTEGSSDKTWRNIAPGATIQRAQCEADGTVRNTNFFFRNTPSFSRAGGFALGPNVVTGPYSHQLGVNANTTVTAMFVARPTGDLPEATSNPPAMPFRMFANTVDNNGITLSMRSGGARVGGDGLIPVSAWLHVGSMPALECAPIAVGGAAAAPSQLLLNPAHRYIWLVVKDYGRLQVSVIDADAAEFKKVVILDTNLGAHANILLSNVDMMLNAGGNWNASIVALGLWSRALRDTDVSDLYNHYHSTFLMFDPAYQALQDALDAANKLRACPYDTATCTACRSVQDWTQLGQVLAAGPTCLKAINAFCTANPTHAQCACWSSAHPDYNDACVGYRAMFSGDAVTIGNVQCPAPPPVPSTAEELAEIKRMLAHQHMHHHRDSSHRRRRRPAPPPPPPPRPQPLPPIPEPICDGSSSESESEGGEKKGFWARLFS